MIWVIAQIGGLITSGLVAFAVILAVAVILFMIKKSRQR